MGGGGGGGGGGSGGGGWGGVGWRGGGFGAGGGGRAPVQFRPGICEGVAATTHEWTVDLHRTGKGHQSGRVWFLELDERRLTMRPSCALTVVPVPTRQTQDETSIIFSASSCLILSIYLSACVFSIALSLAAIANIAQTPRGLGDMKERVSHKPLRSSSGAPTISNRKIAKLRQQLQPANAASVIVEKKSARSPFNGSHKPPITSNLSTSDSFVSHLFYMWRVPYAQNHLDTPSPIGKFVRQSPFVFVHSDGGSQPGYMSGSSTRYTPE
uniref:Uncharacterized protein n=1 Tax=Knipowitschia caucasica TaxID=637954 RepID=A0AAV2L7K0_KNICA